MSLLKKLTGDFIFWFLLICGLIFGISQSFRMLTSTQGVSTSAYFFAWISLALNTHLSLHANRASRSRATVQVLIIQATGLVVYFVFLVVIYLKGNNVWDEKDNLTALLVFCSLFLTTVIGRRLNLSWKDPVVRGVMGLCFKSVPQFIMAYKVWVVGGNGLSGLMMITWHLLTLTRIFQVLIIVREAGWDRNRKGLLISEIGNEFSWLFVTAAWLK